LPGTAHLLREWLSLTEEEREGMGERARELFRSRFTVDAMATSLLDVVMRDSRLTEGDGQLT
jgi:hypothetical protein